MLISLDWLSDFVDLGGLSADEIADRLTVHTAEVEGWESRERSYAGVVAGRVVSLTPLGSGGGLQEAVVDVGGRSLRTVCGAPNIALKQLVAVATPGARLADGSRVAAAEVHGRPSEAVLCSPAELGLSTAHEGLLLLPEDVAPGTALETLLPGSDTLIEIDNKSLTHRPDLWGHYGIARELAAIFGRPLQQYDTVDLRQFEGLPGVDVSIEAADDCPYYAAVRVEASSNPPAPLWMQCRLHAIGSRSRNLLVDVTNYVQFELGQPTHAFDGDKVRSIRVAASGRQREFATLDGKRWSVEADDLLIHEGQRPIALAGIMGGLDSEVSASTRTLLLESANFRAARIRRTSTRLPLRTDASLRFEKKLPPVFARIAISRVLRLFERAGYAHRVVSRLSTAGDARDTPRRINLPPGYITRRAGVEISDATSSELLRGIGWGCRKADDGGLEVSVPAFRGETDISIPEDVSEEVLRLYGYNRIPPQLPPAAIRSTPASLAALNHHRARRVLAQAHSFVEVQSYCWFSDDWLREIGYEPSRPTLNVRNPITVDNRRMRDALLPNLLAFVLQNRRQGDQFRLFELGRTFWLDAEGVKREANELAGVAINQAGGSPEPLFRAVRGAIEDLATAAGLTDLEFLRDGSQGAPWQATQATHLIQRAGESVGAMGLLPAPLRRKLLDSGHGVWFRLEIDRLAGALFPAVDYRSPPVFPGSWQDFTLEWPTSRGYRELQALLQRYEHPTVRRLQFVTLFTPKGQPTSKYTFRFQLGWPDRTLTTEDLQAFREGFLQFAQGHSLTIAQ